MCRTKNNSFSKRIYEEQIVRVTNFNTLPPTKSVLNLPIEKPNCYYLKKKNTSPANMIVLIFVLCLFCSVFGQLSPPPVPQPDIRCASAPNAYFVTNTLGCDQYIVCMSGGEVISGTCPGGYKFNPVNQLCDFSKNVDCTACALYGVQQIADPNSCTIHYECVNGKRTQKACAPGLQFNIHNGNCDLASVVNCDREGGVGPTTGRPTFEPPISTPKPPPIGEYPACVAGGQIFYAHTSLCGSFYLCINGYAWLLHCPATLEWNQAVSACDLPTSAQCSNLRPKGEIKWSDEFMVPMVGTLLE